MKILVLVFLITLLCGFLSYGKPIDSVEIIVCKDNEKRLFFAGELPHFRKYREVFNQDTCKVQTMTLRKWQRILSSYQKRSVKTP